MAIFLHPLTINGLGREVEAIPGIQEAAKNDPRVKPDDDLAVTRLK